MPYAIWAVNTRACQGIVKHEDCYYLISMERNWTPLQLNGRLEAVKWALTSDGSPLGIECDSMSSAINQIRDLTLKNNAVQPAVSFSLISRLHPEKNIVKDKKHEDKVAFNPIAHALDESELLKAKLKYVIDFIHKFNAEEFIQELTRLEITILRNSNGKPYILSNKSDQNQTRRPIHRKPIFQSNRNNRKGAYLYAIRHSKARIRPHAQKLPSPARMQVLKLINRFNCLSRLDKEILYLNKEGYNSTEIARKIKLNVN